MSSLSKLVVFSILSVVLMVADVRYGVTQPLRATISLMLYPMEWLSMRPQWLFDVAGRFFEGRDDAQAQVQAMTLKLQQQALRSGQVEQLALENLQLRREIEHTQAMHVINAQHARYETDLLRSQLAAAPTILHPQARPAIDGPAPVLTETTKLIIRQLNLHNPPAAIAANALAEAAA
jgi:cell shape-determining protein MreC